MVRGNAIKHKGMKKVMLLISKLYAERTKIIADAVNAMSKGIATRDRRIEESCY